MFISHPVESPLPLFSFPQPPPFLGLEVSSDCSIGCAPVSPLYRCPEVLAPFQYHIPRRYSPCLEAQFPLERASPPKSHLMSNPVSQLPTRQSPPPALKLSRFSPRSVNPIGL
ncbi:hypothetical protein ASPSYDRAFT_382925 [Aspergillus sydowii CBS 593.65]|uniref:Uncharacterized protein n=1 Tax=Aspergillus sydowii CBS 593.65 TaxID=1036612 RepID=A0A1L9T8P3_9EURO|nr:uncharacterized protein ASPSYDRAFT_382925 [Aspergillus sydowii CBS 593.65]OJJ55799.1 hypothetical protein ASPSYDRAFT_382925 [Aspergillus sydowii CBS 593.65]